MGAACRRYFGTGASAVAAAAVLGPRPRGGPAAAVPPSHWLALFWLGDAAALAVVRLNVLGGRERVPERLGTVLPERCSTLAWPTGVVCCSRSYGSDRQFKIDRCPQIAGPDDEDGPYPALIREIKHTQHIIRARSTFNLL